SAPRRSRAPKYDETTSWLIEGLADWVRDELGHDASWTKAHYEPGKATTGYRTTARFLRHVERKHPGMPLDSCVSEYEQEVTGA
ncbi:MAG: basic secretory protein-like protein, partial [Actinomycetota bacterium]